MIFKEIVQLVIVLSVAEFIFFPLYIFPSSDVIVLNYQYALQLSLLLNMCSRGSLLSSLKSSMFSPYYFYHLPPIFLESYSIFFGASTFLSPTFFDNGKYVLSYKLHAMGGICKEGWLWNFLIKFSFGWLHNLISGTFGWMLEHSLHCAVIVADYDINYKEAICRMYTLPSSVLQNPSYFLRFPQSSFGSHILLLLSISFTQHQISGRPWNRRPFQWSPCFPHQW